MSIDNLLRIEITLSNIYYRLLMLEIYGEVESGEYTTNLKMLLNILKEESKILDSYTIEELEVIKEIITGKRIETNIDNIFIRRKYYEKDRSYMYSRLSIHFGFRTGNSQRKATNDQAGVTYY